MENYKHTPPNTYYDVTWTHVKDWWTNELGNDWEFPLVSDKYKILGTYNNTHFPNQDKPVKSKPIRYLNRK